MSPTRRDFVKTAATAGGAFALGVGGSAYLKGEAVAESGNIGPEVLDSPRARDLLILGGTSFVGPHLIRYALERGHTVTTFTRGRTEPSIYRDLFREVEQLTGDREGDLGALEKRQWDAVIDNSGRQVEWTRASAQLLKDSVRTYVYTSSTGVYLPYLGTDITEDTPLVLEDPPETPESRRPSYGVMKSLSEIEARNAFGADRTIVVRPTYIVGPADPTNRFPYWPVRVEQGGEVLVPGKADDPIQYIDVRDLAEWMVRLIEDEKSGTFNVAGPGSAMGMHAFVHGVHAATSSPVSWVMASDYDFLRQNGVQAVIPWIMPVGDYVGSARVNIERAVANGLTYRPLAETTADVLEWWHSDAVSEERRDDFVNNERSLFAREEEILAAWRERVG